MRSNLPELETRDLLPVGFTGTREGMTPPQRLTLDLLMSAVRAAVELHHGDCVGSDEQAQLMATNYGWRTVARPAVVPLDLCAFTRSTRRLPPRPPLERNVDIVEETAWLIAAPNTPQEIVRSGTWQTIRAARARHRPVTIIWPDGSRDGDIPKAVREHKSVSSKRDPPNAETGP